MMEVGCATAVPDVAYQTRLIKDRFRRIDIKQYLRLGVKRPSHVARPGCHEGRCRRIDLIPNGIINAYKRSARAGKRLK
jgi:hypothetical protein